MMPVVYVAGPYRAANRKAVELNVETARAVGLLCCRKGWSTIIPHSNTAHLDALDPTLGDAYWLSSTMELLRRSDAVVLVPGWKNSEGTLEEIREAERRGIPVFYNEYQIPTAADFLDMRSSEPGKVPAQVVITNN